MGVTTRYGINYPEDADRPDGPAQLRSLADEVDAALGGVEDQIHTPRKVIGRLPPPGIRGVRVQDVGFRPQLVTFECQVVSPMASSGNPATISLGRIGLDVNGNLVQDLTGVRITTAPFAERRTIYTACAGVVIDDTTISGLAIGALTPTGFTLDFQDTGGTDSIYLWAAFE